MALSQMELSENARRAYRQARRGGYWRALRTSLVKGCNDLVSTAELLERIRSAGQRNLGVQDVPLDRVVGSQRAQDFDLHFNPRRETEDGRWHRVAVAGLNGKKLPPVELLKIEDAYFVVDGNHRVSVARAAGHDHIQGHVIELAASNVEPAEGCSRLGFRVKCAEGC